MLTGGVGVFPPPPQAHPPEFPLISQLLILPKQHWLELTVINKHAIVLATTKRYRTS